MLAQQIILNTPETSPYIHHFADIQWAIFGTLTWNEENRRAIGAEWYRHDDFRKLMCEASRLFRIRGKNLAYYRCLEYGKADECHYHFLIARDGIEKVNAKIFAATLQNLWQTKILPFDSQGQGVGRADVRPYEQAQGLAGVNYCLKVEHGKERFDFVSSPLRKLIARETL